jgi:hypothetical protein
MLPVPPEPTVLLKSELPDVIEFHRNETETGKLEIMDLFAEHNAILAGHFRLNHYAHTNLNLIPSRLLTCPDATRFIVQKLLERLKTLRYPYGHLILATNNDDDILLAAPLAYEDKLELYMAETTSSHLYRRLRGRDKLVPSKRFIMVKPYLADYHALYKYFESINKLAPSENFLLNYCGAVVCIAGITKNPENVKFSDPIETFLGNYFPISLFNLNAQTWNRRRCPLCEDKIPLLEMGELPNYPNI